jgi:hypothetical protein
LLNCAIGNFTIFELGAFVHLDGIKIVYFNALRQHGGSAPRAPAGSVLASHAYRWTVVNYAPAVIYQNQGVYVLAALRKTDLKASKPFCSYIQLMA